MKLASILVPAYLPRAHAAATPTPYNSGVVDKFERELAQMVPLLVRHFNCASLTPDTNGRFVKQEILTRYDVGIEDFDRANLKTKLIEGFVSTVMLAEAIALVLKAFALANVIVIYRDDVQDFGPEKVEELREGLHEWCTD